MGVAVNYKVYIFPLNESDIITVFGTIMGQGENGFFGYLP